MKLSKFLYLLLVLTASVVSEAKSLWRPQLTPPPFPIEVTVLRTFGNACPPGSIAATMSPDNTSVSILFDQFTTDLPPTPIMVRDQRTCSISLGLKFAGQYRVAIVGSDVRGFVSAPANAMTTVSVKHSSTFAPGRYSDKMNFMQSFRGPIEQNIEMFSRFADLPLWSYCGTQLRGAAANFPFMTITMEINSRTQNSESNLLASIDSFDFSTNAPLSYQIAWTADTKSCPR